MAQIREKLEDTEYILVAIDEHIVVGVQGHYIGDWPERREACLRHKETGRQELWMECDEFAGYVIEIDGMGFEYVRSF